MIIDAYSNDIPEEFDADICVFGAGAMGIAIAREFLGSQTRILLVESGGEEYDDDTHLLDKMTISGLTPIDDPEISRLRYLGGSTNHWGGWSRPFAKEVIDKWPVDNDELASFYPRIIDFLDLQHKSFERLDDWGETPEQEFISYGAGLKTRMRQIYPLRFWAEFGNEIAASANITVIKNANLFNFSYRNDNSRVDRATLKTLRGRELRVKAKRYVMACGGLENPQILLNIDRLNNDEMTKKTPLIGKYYMDHYALQSEMVPLKCFSPNFAGRKQFAQYETAEDEETKYFFVRPGFYLDPTLPEYADLPQHNVTMGEFHARCSFTKADEADDLYGQMRKFGRNVELSTMHMFIESTPNEASEISLTDQRNALGHFVGDLNWQINSSDKEAVTFIAKNFERRMAENGVARMRISRNIEEYGILRPDGVILNDRHHMGTTRMSVSSRDGVVDPNSKMHGMDNLYVAGTSVFPTYDWPGPTFTALAMTFRLTDHLKTL